MTSVPRTFRCRSPLITGSESSSRSEMSDDQAALDQRLGELVQRPRRVGLPPGLHPLERQQQRVQVAGRARRPAAGT